MKLKDGMGRFGRIQSHIFVSPLKLLMRRGAYLGIVEMTQNEGITCTEIKKWIGI